MFNIFKKKDKSEKKLFNDGLRLNDAEVDILAIVSNNKIVYLNHASDYLFKKDKAGDDKLEGSAVSIVFTEQSGSGVIEIFIAFDENDSYMMFTVHQGMMERLNYVTQAVYNFCTRNIPDLFTSASGYSTQYIYSFKVFRVKDRYIMVNNTQTKGYIIDNEKILRGSGGEMKKLFWGNEQLST